MSENSDSKTVQQKNRTETELVAFLPTAHLHKMLPAYSEKWSLAFYLSLSG